MHNCVTKTTVIIIKGRDKLENIGVDAMIILKWISIKVGGWGLN
jgi:hypothetical protein